MACGVIQGCHATARIPREARHDAPALVSGAESLAVVDRPDEALRVEPELRRSPDLIALEGFRPH
jgi:hypothetical protein